MLWICAIALAGVLIGATGIGGVLVVPALHELHGIDFRASIAAASLAFGLPGIGALWGMRRTRGALPRAELTRADLFLIAATLPGAVLGGLFIHAIETTSLLGVLGVATLASGLWGLVAREHLVRAPPLRPSSACTAGCAVGFASAVTGTGGPVVLWPVMMAARQDVRTSLLVAQAIQLPIALCASAVHVASGAIDLKLSAVVGAVLVAGALVGQSAATRLSARLLQICVCLLLVATGGFYLLRSVA